MKHFLRTSLTALIVFLGYVLTSNAATYYVDGNLGDDSRSNSQAQNSATPWQTIRQGLVSSLAYDTIVVAAGTYNEADTITKPVVLLGNNGSGVQPIVQTNEMAAFTVQAKNVTIRNFKILVNQVGNLYGIYTANTGFSNLVLDKDTILSTKAGVGLVFGSYGVFLNGLSDTVTVTRCAMIPASVNNNVFGRGMRMNGCQGVVGGSPQEANYMAAVYGLQWASTWGGKSEVSYNVFAGQGLQIVAPRLSADTMMVHHNDFNPLSNQIAVCAEVKANASGRNVLITNNTFSKYTFSAVWVHRSKSVFVTNNTFTADSAASAFADIYIDTKQQTSAASQTILFNTSSYYGNTFNGSKVGGGYAFLIQDLDHRLTNQFSLKIGSATSPNVFAGNYNKFVSLDTANGTSLNRTGWAGYPSTPTRRVSTNIDLSNNLFKVGANATAQLPATMSLTDLFLLENELSHRPDYDSLGFLTVVPNNVYVSDSSFVAVGGMHSLNRVLRDMPNGNTVHTQSNDFSTETLQPTVTATLISNAPGRINVGGYVAQGGTLTLATDIATPSLALSGSGLVDASNSKLVVTNASGVSGGSTNSWVVTGVQTNGGLQVNGVSTAPVTFPIGTATSFAPVTFTDINNTQDSITARVMPAATPSAFMPALPGNITKYVNLQWDLSEANPGGSNATVAFSFQPSNLINGPLTPAIILAHYNGTYWDQLNGTLAGNTVSTSGLTNFSPFAIYSYTSVAGSKYYVNKLTGDDNRSNGQALDPATPWKTISNGINKAVGTDTIIVAGNVLGANNTYTENLEVDKALTIIGTSVAGVKPIINGTSAPQVINIGSPNITISNFRILVNQTNTTAGLYAANISFNNLTVTDNEIFSNQLAVAGPCVNFATYGIRLLGNSDSITILRNMFAPAAPNRCAFGRGIRLVGCHGPIGSTLASDSNTFLALFGIQSGNPQGGALKVQHNSFRGQAFEINNPTTNSGTHLFRNNKCFLDEAVNAGLLSVIEIKNNSNTGTQVIIDSNTISNFINNVVFSTRSNKVIIKDNVFNPKDIVAPVYKAIVANTKQQTIGTAATQTPFTNGIKVYGNTLNGTTALGGVGVELQNHNANAPVAFDTVAIGGAGNLANTFAGSMSKFIQLNTASGTSATTAPWNTFPTNTQTQMAPVDVNFDAQFNKFTLGVGNVKFPSQMTTAELFQLEDKIVHNTSFDSLGFVSVVNNNAYVTSNSFLAAKANSPSLQRVVAKTASPLTINTNQSTFLEGLFVTKPLAIKQFGLTGTTTLNNITTQGGSLSLTEPVKLLQGLTLDTGIIYLNNTTLTLALSATSTGGNDSSYVATIGASKLVKEGMPAGPVLFPIGTSTSFAPVTFNDANNTNDNISASVVPRTTKGSFVPSLPQYVQRFVKLQWDISEVVPGGSNATLTFGWSAKDQVKPLNLQTKIGHYVNNAWLQGAASYNALTATGSGFTSFSPFAVWGSDNQAGKRYYVDNVTGDDTRDTAQAKFKATPWKTITKAMHTVMNGDSVSVFPFAGTYASNDTIRKSIELTGITVAGVRPTISGDNAPALITLGYDSIVPNITFKNFNLIVSQANTKTGILAERSGYDNLILDSLNIVSNANSTPTDVLVFNSYGVNLKSDSADEFSITNSRIVPAALTGKKAFGRAMRLSGGYGIVNKNYFAAYYGVQAQQTEGGTLEISSDTLAGIGVEINTPMGNAAVMVKNNIFDPLVPAQIISCAQIKSNVNGATITFKKNTFKNFANVGVLSTRSAKVSLDSNIFQPLALASAFRAVHVNTKQQTSAIVEPSFTSSVSITNNQFLGSGVVGGVGIEFANYDKRCDPPFTNLVVGTQTGPNIFSNQLRLVIRNDSTSGSSNTSLLFAEAGLANTTTKPSGASFFAGFNLFDVGSGLKLPANMSLTELYALEDLIQHAPDYDSLGFISITPNNSYVTANSFILPMTTVASLGRATNVTPAGGIVNTNVYTFNENVAVAKSITWNAAPSAPLTVNQLTMDAPNAVLRFNQRQYVEVNLNLLGLGGFVDLQGQDLVLKTNALSTIGTVNSFVVTSGTGRMMKQNIALNTNNFPVGPNTNSYSPVVFLDANNTSDSLAVSTKLAASASAYSQPLPPSTIGNAGVEWDLKEGVPGGSNANVSFGWQLNTENGAPLTQDIKIGHYTNGAWLANPPAAFTLSPRSATSNNLTSFSPFAVWRDPSPILIAAAIQGGIPTQTQPFCVGDSVFINVVTGNTFTAGNVFTAELSDATGNFGSPTIIGSVTDTTATVIRTVIPALPQGTAYAVRIVSSSPAYTSFGSASTITINVPPAATTITPSVANATFCAGDSIKLSAPVGFASYLWSTNATTREIFVKTANSFRVKVANANGCFSPASAVITTIVNPIPAKPIVTAVSTAYCANGSVLLQGPAGFTGYLWSTGEVTQNISVSTVSLVSLKVSNAAGCFSISSDTISVTALPVTPQPTITPITALQVCVGQTVTLSGPAGFTDYIWSNGAPNTQQISITAQGTQTISLIVKAANGCPSTASASVQVVISPLPTSPTISAPSNTFCQGDSILVTASGSAPAYRWYVNGAFVTSTFGNTYSIKIGGRLTSRADNSGCLSDTTTGITFIVNPKPAAATLTTTTSTTFCQGDSVFLNATAGSLSYKFYRNGVLVSTQPSNVYTAKLSGNYKVIVSTATCSSDSSTNAVNVVVNAVPNTPTFTPNGVTNVCQVGATPISVTLTAPTGFPAYRWFLNGAFQTVTATNTFNATSAGIWRLQVGNGNCNSLLSNDSLLINVSPAPAMPTISASKTSVCSYGDTVLLSAPAGFATYDWFLNGGLLVSSSNNTLKTAVGGNFTLVVKTAFPCSSPVSSAITINQLTSPAAPAISAGGNTTFCQGGSVALNGPAGFAGYLWSNGATTQNIVAQFSGIYSLQVQDVNTCLSPPSTSIVVTANTPVVPTITVTGNVIFCQGDSVTLTASLATSYSWSTGEVSRSIKVKGAGAYTVTAVDGNGCSATSAAFNVLVYPLPVIASTTPTVKLTKGGTTRLGVTMASSSAPVVSYQWAPNDGLDNNTSATPMASPVKTTIYTITVTTANGCQAIAFDTVKVSDGIFVPNLFSPNNDGKNDVFKIYGFGITEVRLIIYNRRGNLVFETSDVNVATNIGWDGTKDGVLLESDTYFWNLTGKLSTGASISYDGKNTGTLFLNK